MRRGLTVESWVAVMTDWLSVADKDLEQEYRRRNDKIKLAVVSFTADTFRGSVSVSDADVASYFDAHKADFKIPEKRKIRYMLIDIDAMRAKVVVPPADIERTYNNNIEQYTTPEQVRASHILLKTEGKDDATVKAKAEDVLKQARGGSDFAELAKKFSEDESSAKNGGDLDYFGRGRMVPEFDQAAFAMQPNQISDLVKTQYGYHIIKVVKLPTTSREHGSRSPISSHTSAHRRRRACSRRTWKSKSASRRISIGSLRRTPTVQSSGRDEPILGLAWRWCCESRVRHEAGDVSGACARGSVFERHRQAGSVHPEAGRSEGSRRDDVVKASAR